VAHLGYSAIPNNKNKAQALIEDTMLCFDSENKIKLFNPSENNNNNI